MWYVFWYCIWYVLWAELGKGAYIRSVLTKPETESKMGYMGRFRPFLMLSDSASRKRPFSTGLFFDWILLVLLIVSRVDFIFFVLFLEAVGVREYCCTAGEIGWQLCASRCLREQRLEEPSFQRVGGFGLSRKPPKLRSWSCTPPRAAKATASAAVFGSMGSRPRAAAVVWYTLLASGTRNASRWLAARSNSRDSQASVSALYDTAVWYLVWVCGRVAVWVCIWWWDGRCDRFKKHV